MPDARMIGEWWISSHGDVEYADGDVGDANHELIACQHALHEVADRLGYDVDVEQGDTLISVLELYGSEHEIGMPGDPAAELAARWDAVEAVLRGLMVPEPGTLLNIANGQGDSRAYACQHWGWKAVRGNHVESWTLTKDDLEMIARGIGQILDMFSYDDHEDVLDGMVLHISTYTGPRLITTYGALVRGEPLERGEDSAAAARVAAAQLRKQTQQGMSKIYKGIIGDCSPARFCALLG